MKKQITLIVIGLISLQSAVSFADNEVAGSGPSPYLDCGIGGALFKDVGWAAVTSNVIWDAGTTAVTSATASPETCNSKSVKAVSFINHSYDNLIEDTAKGQGEYVTAMLDIYGCNDASRPMITQEVRNQIGKEVSESTYVSKDRRQKVLNFFNVIDTTVNSKYSKSCSA